MYNYYREPWLIDRLALTAQTAFGHKPCVDEVGGGLQQAVITVGLSEAGTALWHRWAGPAAATPDPATDDRPFLYLFGATIPLLYLVTLGLILRSARPPWRSPAGGAVPADACRTPTCSCSAWASCCWRPRASPGSPCCSGRPGWSTRSCSPESWSPFSPRSR